MKRTNRFLSMLGVAALAFALPVTASATVKKEGAWPATEKKVDLEFDGRPSEGLRELAKEAGWSLVVADGALVDRGGGDVHVAVESQPADAVLEALFVGRNVVAYRNGSLVTVTAAPGGAASGVAVPAAPVPPMPPLAPTPPAAHPDAVPPAPPVPAVRGEDRSVLGDSQVIAKNEVVHTVTVAGGTLKVEGTITGDLVVAGGSAKIVGGGRVVGNATVFGGSLKVEKDARVDGDVGVVGGVLKREEGAIIGGNVVDGDHGGRVNVSVEDGETKTHVSASDHAPTRSRLSAAVHSFGHSVTRMSLLFVLGCVLLALMAPPMEKLRVEVAARPMRSFAMGLVWSLLGTLGAAILLTILCITVIGIPIAIFAVLVAAIAIYGAVASVLTTFGAAILQHRTQNPYLHLLLGCGAFLVVSSLPWIGPLVTVVVTLVAIGALIVTRAGGLLDRRRGAPPALIY